MKPATVNCELDTLKSILSKPPLELLEAVSADLVKDDRTEEAVEHLQDFTIALSSAFADVGVIAKVDLGRTA